MSAQDGPPQGMETKNVPGYVVAQTVNADHPGHMTDQFAGSAGYSNTPGITDPDDEKSGDAEQDSGDGKTTAKKTATTTKTSGTPAK